MRTNTPMTSLSGMVLLMCMLAMSHANGQWIRESHPEYRFGFGAGFTVSGFTGDSAGFTGTAMPFGSMFLEADLHPKIGLSGELNYMIYGINRETPYQRYRYPYVSAQVTAGYTFLGFLHLGVGYRYGFAQNARRSLLDGNSASGVTKADIPSLGNYGQWMAMGDIRLEKGTTITLRYGIPTASVPLKHVQLGVRINLDAYSRSDKLKADQKRQQTAQIQALMLKEGVLLVRLKSMRSSIEAMEAHGMMQDAATLREATHRENLQVIQAFGKYTYSKVLFFYDYHSNQVRKGQLDSVLLDHRLLPVHIDTPLQHVFTAAIGFYNSPERSYHTRRDPQ
jgi:hypothetical protein